MSPSLPEKVASGEKIEGAKRKNIRETEGLDLTLSMGIGDNSRFLFSTTIPHYCGSSSRSCSTMVAEKAATKLTKEKREKT